eukprot:ANDGO_02641.mRNA.1 hypothetical protein
MSVRDDWGQTRSSFHPAVVTVQDTLNVLEQRLEEARHTLPPRPSSFALSYPSLSHLSVGSWNPTSTKSSSSVSAFPIPGGGGGTSSSLSLSSLPLQHDRTVTHALSWDSPSKLYKDEENFWLSRKSSNSGKASTKHHHSSTTAIDNCDSSSSCSSPDRSHSSAASATPEPRKDKKHKENDKNGTRKGGEGDTEAQKMRALAIENAQLRDKLDDAGMQLNRVLRQASKLETDLQEERTEFSRYKEHERNEKSRMQQENLDMRREYEHTIGELKSQIMSSTNAVANGSGSGNCAVLATSPAASVNLAENDNLKKQVDAMRASLSSSQKTNIEYQKLIAQLKNAHVYDLETQKEKYESHLQSVASQHEQALGDARQREERRIADLKQHYEEQISRLNAEVQRVSSKWSTLQKEHERFARDAEAEREYQLYLLNERFKSEKDALRSHFEYELLRIAETRPSLVRFDEDAPALQDSDKPSAPQTLNGPPNSYPPNAPTSTGDLMGNKVASPNRSVATKRSSMPSAATGSSSEVLKSRPSASASDNELPRSEDPPLPFVSSKDGPVSVAASAPSDAFVLSDPSCSEPALSDQNSVTPVKYSRPLAPFFTGERTETYNALNPFRRSIEEKAPKSSSKRSPMRRKARARPNLSDSGERVAFDSDSEDVPAMQPGGSKYTDMLESYLAKMSQTS